MGLEIHNDDVKKYYALVFGILKILDICWTSLKKNSLQFCRNIGNAFKKKNLATFSTTRTLFIISTIVGLVIQCNILARIKQT